MDCPISVPFWNWKSLPPPKNVSLKLTSSGRNVGLFRRVCDIRSCLSEIMSKLKKTSFLHKEAAILSRLVYRMKRVFRQDKGFKFIEMLLKTLRNYLSMDLLHVIKTIRDGCYENNCASKQMIEWGLVSLMRFSALIHRARSLAEKAASIIKERFSSGHHWKLAALCLGVVSRIWVLAGFLESSTVSWFSKLKSVLALATATDEEWLPTDCNLPDQLDEWLGYTSVTFNELKNGKGASNVADKVPGQSKMDYKQNKQKSKMFKPAPLNPDDLLTTSLPMDLNEDVGEVIPRECADNEKSLKRKDQTKEKPSPKKKRKKV